MEKKTKISNWCLDYAYDSYLLVAELSRVCDPRKCRNGIAFILVVINLSRLARRSHVTKKITLRFTPFDMILHSTPPFIFFEKSDGTSPRSSSFGCLTRNIWILYQTNYNRTYDGIRQTLCS